MFKIHLLSAENHNPGNSKLLELMAFLLEYQVYRCSQCQRQNLRKKFLQQARKYFFLHKRTISAKDISEGALIGRLKKLVSLTNISVFFYFFKF